MYLLSFSTLLHLNDSFPFKMSLAGSIQVDVDFRILCDAVLCDERVQLTVFNLITGHLPPAIWCLAAPLPNTFARLCSVWPSPLPSAQCAQGSAAL